MLFNSMEFVLFFPAVLFMYFLIPACIKNYWLLAASYYFYMCWNAKYALLLFSSTVITYTGGILLQKINAGGGIRVFIYLDKAKSKKIVVAICCIMNLGILCYFKYMNFLLNLLRGALSFVHIELEIPMYDILLPVGISFYIFQAMSYTIDVYRGEIQAEKKFFLYALFVSFFPQLVAGPIERSGSLLKQLQTPKRFCYDSVRTGLLWMLWGYFLKMVVSDRCAVLVNHVYGDYGSYQGFQLIIANILFAFQIYCDFMGYSVIAKGAAKILDFDLIDNFRQPYLAESIKDFWRRWHISLSSWLRDYLYIPLGGNKKSKFLKYRNLMITFLMSGLWHGANMTFVLWGGIHGVYQIAEELLSPVFLRVCEKIHVRMHTFSWKLLRMIRTFIFVDIAWVFFRAESIEMACRILKRSLLLSNSGLILNHGLFQLGLDERNMVILSLSLIVILIVGIMREKGIHVLEWLSKQNMIFRYAVYWSAVVSIVFSMDITGQEFIYFQF